MFLCHYVKINKKLSNSVISNEFFHQAIDFGISWLEAFALFCCEHHVFDLFNFSRRTAHTQPFWVVLDIINAPFVNFEVWTIIEHFSIVSSSFLKAYSNLGDAYKDR